jgi:FdhD protein
MSRTSQSVRRTTSPVRVASVRDGSALDRGDRLAVEEPLEIRAGGPGQEAVSVAVTMRTPGADFELAAGFLVTEGLIGGHGDIASVAYCELPDEEQQYNVVTVRLTSPFDASRLARNFFATSSCGVCGKASLDHVRLVCPRIEPGPVLGRSAILAMPDAVRSAQRIFEQTGGLHAAALFDAQGRLGEVREDVGRHNAVDKLVGHAVLDSCLPLSANALFVSGRVSFEIVQKAAMAGLPIVCAVSAPSSLAVDTASELGMTVVGFVRGSGFNVYTGSERVDVDG